MRDKIYLSDTLFNTEEGKKSMTLNACYIHNPVQKSTISIKLSEFELFDVNLTGCNGPN